MTREAFFSLLLLIFLIIAPAAGSDTTASPFDRYDVLHYDIAIRFDLPAKSFSGAVTMTFETNETLPSCDFHASDRAITIDSILSQHRRLEFRRHGDTVSAIFPSVIPPHSRIDIVTYYHGHSIFSGQYDDGGVYIPDSANFEHLATISEPFYARRWWPCKDLPADKATVSVEVNVSEKLTAVSNGLLKSVRHGTDGRTSYRWESSYPIATYLVSVAVAPFREIHTRYHTLSGQTMPMSYYVYPADSAKAVIDFQGTDSILHFFAKRFCEYPFVNEKFGFAEVDGDLTMENQTLCSISASIINGTRSNETVYIHETVHHWWGDLITPKTWHDTWLNEGFATYSEALYVEEKKGIDSYRQYVDGWMRVPPGSFRTPVIAKSDTSFWDCFALSVYLKGAIVLHMLRGVVGDSVFFATLRAYVNSPRLRYATATTDDFIGIAEHQYGKSLRWFFDEWLSAPPDSFDRATYRFSWKNDTVAPGKRITVTLEQPVVKNRLYRMPVEVGIYAKGKADYVTFTDSARTQTATFRSSSIPDSVIFDPHRLIFKSIEPGESGGIR
jgi:aminopeptidase N